MNMTEEGEDLEQSPSNAKKVYVWKLASFLARNGMIMSGDELTDHLNRNGILTEYGTAYSGGRGVFTLIRVTWHWLHDDLQLGKEAEYVAVAFVNQDGEHAYKV